MVQILLSPHFPLGSCLTERPSLHTCTWLRSSYPLSCTTGDMAEILISSPMLHWEHVSLSIHHCIHGTDPPLLPHFQQGTCLTDCPHCIHVNGDPPIFSHVGTTGDMAEILLSSPMLHWEHVSMSVHQCIHGTDPSLLPHPPLRTCVTYHPWVHITDPPLRPHFPLGTCLTECPPLCTWLRSSYPLLSTTRDMSD